MTSALCKSGLHTWVYVGAPQHERYCKRRGCGLHQIRSGDGEPWEELEKRIDRVAKQVYLSLNQKRFELKPIGSTRPESGLGPPKDLK